MKKIQIILLVSVLLVALSGCGNQKLQNNDNRTNKNNNTATDDNNNTVSNSDSKNVDRNTSKAEDKTDGTNNNTSSQDTAKEINGNIKSFYGNWQIKKVLGYAKITTGGDESLIGLKITLSKELATLGNKFYDNPKYEITNKTKNEVTSSFKTNLSDIGVNDNSINKLDVLNKEDTDGMTFFIKDNNVLIYYLDGTYYETIRVS